MSEAAMKEIRNLKTKKDPTTGHLDAIEFDAPTPAGDTHFTASVIAVGVASQSHDDQQGQRPEPSRTSLLWEVAVESERRAVPYEENEGAVDAAKRMRRAFEFERD
jgi:hypothetical protein